MPYYHVKIRKNNSDKWIFAYDLTKKEAKEKFLSPFDKQMTFMCESNVIRHSEIDKFGIIETKLSSSEIHKKTKTKRVAEKFFGSRDDEDLYSVDERELVNSGRDVTEELRMELNIQGQERPKPDSSLMIIPEEDNVYDKGQVYDFYKDIKAISLTANTEFFLVDSYVDEEVLDLYIAKLPSNINIKILTNKIQDNFLTVAKKLKLKPNVKFEVRQNTDCHDRLLFVDNVCWIMGQSIKDAAKKPTYLVRIDASELFKKVFEDLWKVSKVIV